MKIAIRNNFFLILCFTITLPTLAINKIDSSVSILGGYMGRSPSELNSRLAANNLALVKSDGYTAGFSIGGHFDKVLFEFFYIPSLANSTQNGNLYTGLAADQAFINGGYQFSLFTDNFSITPVLGLGIIKTSLDIHKEVIASFDNALQGGITAMEIKKQDIATNLGISIDYALPMSFGKVILSLRSGYIITFNTSDWSIGGSSDNVFGFNQSWPVSSGPKNITNGFYVTIASGVRVNLYTKKPK